MDRELLLEIGVEEMPASWLPPLAAELAEKLKTRLTESGLPVKVAIESHATPRRLAACVPELVDRQDDRDEVVMGPPVSVAFDAEGHPTNAGLGFARKLGYRLRRGRPAGHAARQVPLVHEAAPRQGDGGRAAGRARQGAARPDVPEADALGRRARGRQGRVRLRPAGPVAAVPLRRSRRAVHDRPPGRRVESARAGRLVGRRHLRPSVPRDERPRRSRHQGAHLRRVPEEARRELRPAVAHRSARPHPARPRSAGPPHRRTRDCCRDAHRPRRCSTKFRTSSSFPPSCRAPSARSSSSSPKKC